MSLEFGGANDIKWGVLSAANIFLTSTEFLYASGTYSQYFELDLATAPSIRWLRLERFVNGKNITSAAAGFPLLEFLYLTDLKNIDEIWDDDAPLPSGSFKTLIDLRLVNLYHLKRMGKCVLSTAKNFFLQLETIHIENCGEMEHLLELVPDKEEQDKEDDIKLLFRDLKSLRLCELPKLTSICSRGIESIQFPELARMVIEGECGKLKWLVSRDDDDDGDGDSSHLFCHPKVSFPKLGRLFLTSNKECKNVWCNKVPIGFFKGLVKLSIKKYVKIRSLFSSSEIPRNLVNLQRLVLSDCDEIVTVMEYEEEVSSSSSSRDDHTAKHTTTLFPKLQEISLIFLPKLESFCKWRCALEFPSLKKLSIILCGELKSFNAVAGSHVITPALQIMRSHGKDLEFADDLNATLKQHFEKIKDKKLTSSSSSSRLLRRN